MSETQMKSIVKSASQFVSDMYYNGNPVSSWVKNTPLYKYRLAQSINDIAGLLEAVKDYNSNNPSYQN